MTMRWLLAALLTGLLVFTSGATQAQDNKAKLVESPWYPLAVGTKWAYKSGDNKCVYRVAAHEDFGGTLCAKVEMFIDNKLISYEHISSSEKGVFRNGFQGAKADVPVQILALPFAKDIKPWKVESKALGDGKVTGEFTESEEEIKIGDKTYKTLKVYGKDMDANGLKFSATYYFAENFGMVKQVIVVGETTKQETILELEKYDGIEKKEPVKDKEKDK